MAENKKSKSKCGNSIKRNSGCGGAYFLGMIGAAVYYIQQSETFWAGVLALLKAIVWPAFLVYKLLG
jgi:hypothetical protein